MKTMLAYAVGFSMTFSVIAGGMYFLSGRYPWMFGGSSENNNGGQLKSTVAVPAVIGGTELAGAARDSTKNENETINTLKTILAEKNDSISAKNDSIQQLNSTIAQLQKKSSDANNVIAQLQSQVNSWNSERRKELAGAYNEMDAPTVAKIMKNLDDRDILFILSSVQKKQAAKILGDLDPARAAKLMSSLGQSK